MLTEAENINYIVLSGGEVNGIFMGAGKVFWKIETDIDTITRTVEYRGDGRLNKYVHRIGFDLSRPSVDSNFLADELRKTSGAGIVALVFDSNNHGWLVGYHSTFGKIGAPLSLADLKKESETNVKTFTLETESNYPDLKLTDALADAYIDELEGGVTVSGGLRIKTDGDIGGKVIKTEDGKYILTG